MAFSFITFVPLLCLAALASTQDVQRVQIPNTSLWTNTKYQIGDGQAPGFSVLTYADVFTGSGEKFVQMDDHQNREEKYAPGGEWFPDGLWTFKRFNEVESFVSIHPVVSPEKMLVLDETIQSPQGDEAPPQTYLILSSAQQYKDLGDNRLYGAWIVMEREEGRFVLYNVGSRKFAYVADRFGSNFYKWVTVFEGEYIFNIKKFD